ncbi:MAG: triple tyrosine motif-containing protein [Bacteroidota bacterium]
MKKTVALILIWQSILLSFNVCSAQASYLVTHYNRNQYAAGSQNWSVDMDRQGFVYVANNDGLLVYDGVKWKLNRIPARTIIRSVSAASDGRIYTGSYEEFGYWELNKQRVLNYHSLIPLLNGRNIHNSEIWKIVQANGKVYFQGFSCIFVYDKKSIKAIALPRSVVFLLQAGNRLFVQEVRGNLDEIVNDKLVNIDKNNVLKNTEVKTILPFGKDSYLIGTSSDGLFLFDGRSVSPWNAEANPLLKEYQINNGMIFGDKLVFGTIVKGVIILDRQGHLLNHLHSENDLQNNTVLSLYNDHDQNIWVGLDNGIDNISFNNPVDVYQGRNEALGAVYTAALYNNTLYVGTNRGIFTYTKSGDRFLYKGFLKNSQGQVWQLKIIDGTLFCGHTNGTYSIENNELKLISEVSGGYMIQKIMANGQEYLIQSTYSSLLIYKKSGTNWVYSHQVAGFLEPARFLEADHLGNIWVSHTVKGLYRLRLSANLEKVAEIQIFGQKDGLPSDFNIRVFKIANRVVFSTGQRLFTWDDLNQKIIPYTEFNQNLGGFENATSVSQAAENMYWFVTNDEAALFDIHSKQPEMKYRMILPQYNLNMVDGYENIISLNENLHFLCLNNGFAIYNSNYTKSIIPENSSVLLRDFSCWNSKGEKIAKELTGSSIALENAFNNISVSFSSLRNPCSRRLFQTMLEGIDHGWSRWSEKAMAEYTRLPVGKYRFKVRTLTQNGSITEPVTIAFTVKPAWYASAFATLVYILLALGGILLSQYYYRKRLEKHHQNLTQIANEKREVEKQHAEQEIITLQNEKLQAEISHKNLQLADSTMSIIRKNEVLIEIKEELEKQKEELGPRYPARYLQRLTTLIDRNISNDNDWEIFEALFDQAHENFFKRLKLSFPDLTQSDLKLSAYLKLNLSSKEIAPLLNISVRGVEIRRYRLRKRLSLTTDDNLVEYIMRF